MFFETGTFKGEGVQLALEVGYPEIYSIEVLENYHTAAKEKFGHLKEVHLFLGSSSERLFEIASDINPEKKIVFWLDGHCPGTDVPQDVACPLLAELEQISRLQRKDHILLIDDVRCFGNILKETNEQIKDSLLKINSEYNIKYIDSKLSPKDILLATVD